MSATAEESPPVAPAPAGVIDSRKAFVVRWAQAVGFVALWVSLGFALHLGGSAYLLLGVPLTLAFQLGLRRRPVRDLWVRDGAPARLTTRVALVAAALLVTPLLQLMRSQQHGWVHVGWNAALAVGALAAAHAFCQLTRANVRQLLLCLVIAGALLGAGPSVALVFAGAALKHKQIHLDLQHGVSQLLVYVPISFVLEEVCFRGLLDAHVHLGREARGFGSAFFVSAIWGLWHLPIVPADVPWWVMAPSLIVTHALAGVPLSYFWRKSGNLAVPAFSHAFMDAVRDALSLG